MSFKSRVDRLKQDRNTARAVLNKLTDDAIEDLVRIGQHKVSDGHSTRSMGDGTGSRSAADDTATERAALRNGAPEDSDRPDTWAEIDVDEIGKALRSIELELRRIAAKASTIERSRGFITHVGSKLRGHVSSAGECKCCGRGVVKADLHDRLKSGYCPACYTAWQRAGRPADRLGFEVARRRDLREAGVDVPAVTEGEKEEVARRRHVDDIEEAS